MRSSGELRRRPYLPEAPPQWGGRRSSYEFWCKCLSSGGCYLANSHVRPLLQIIDDFGRFRGWVGTEVSPDRNNDGIRRLASEHYSVFALVER